MWTLKDDLASCHVIIVITIKITPSERFFSTLFTASYPKASSSMKICAQRKAGRRKRARWRFTSLLSPFNGNLPFVTGHSRFAIASVGKAKGLRRPEELHCSCENHSIPFVARMRAISPFEQATRERLAKGGERARSFPASPRGFVAD